MRTRLLGVSLAITVLAAAACGGEADEGVAGSGEIFKDTRFVEGFDHIVFASEGEVRFTQGDTESLTIWTDDNLLELIETSVVDRQLVIRTREDVDIDPTDTVRYEIGVIDLEGLELSGAGSLVADAWSVDDADIVLSGAGGISIHGLEADTLGVELSGAGDIALAGAVRVQDVTLSGAGQYRAADLASTDASVVASGAGSATVWVSGSLDALVSGAGSVAYKGDPEVTQEVTGVGTISPLGSS